MFFGIIDTAPLTRGATDSSHKKKRPRVGAVKRQNRCKFPSTRDKRANCDFSSAAATGRLDRLQNAQNKYAIPTTRMLPATRNRNSERRSEPRLRSTECVVWSSAR